MTRGAGSGTAAVPPSRLYSLDALRGIAALSVVFWHWQHFFFRDGVVVPFDRSTQPFYRVLFLLYESGWIAVDLFFSLSGFVFFWLYASEVHDHRVGAWRFSVLRFSRLYPLHAVTLLLVIIGLAVFHHAGLTAFTYPANDARHFVLQLFLASNWGIERSPSFNAPVWSVSVEVLLYGIFYLVCRHVHRTLGAVATLIALGFWLSCFTQFGLQGRGVFSFFLGGLSFVIYRELAWPPRAVWARVIVTVLAAVGWGWVVIGHLHHPAFLFPFATPVSWAELHSAGPSALARHLPRLAVTGVVFPLTLIALALLETRWAGLGRRLAPLGDISYSSYLVHFPLQMLFYGVAVAMHREATFFRTDASLLLFMSALIGLSFASHHWLERPAQRALRARLLAGARTGEPPAGSG